MNLDDFDVEQTPEGLQYFLRGKTIDLSIVKEDITSLLMQLGDLYSEKKVATVELIHPGALIEDDVIAFYRLKKNNSRVVQVNATLTSILPQMTTVSGRLLDYQVFCQAQRSSFSEGREKLPSVQEFKTMDGIPIPYDHFTLHKLLAREVPLLRF